MSMEFSNTYQEILLENLMSVIKQNFMFQTQIKLIENTAKEKEELEKSYVELKKQFDELINNYNLSKGDLDQIEIYKNKAEQNLSAHEEKSRIQSALNEEMKKSSTLKKEMEDTILQLQKALKNKNDEFVLLKEYVLKLEDVVPVTKLKKINPPKVFEELKNEAPKIENKLQIKVLDGSSF